MKILFVLEHFYPAVGGVETLFKSLAERLAGQGHQVTVLTTRSEPDSPQQETYQGIKIIRLDVRSRYLFTFAALPRVIRLARDFDLVHTTSYNAGLPAFLGAKWSGRKVMITFHEVWGKLWFRLPFMSFPARLAHFLFEQMLLRLPFDRFIGVSQSTTERLRESGVASRRIATIYNGIDYSDFTERQDDPPPGPFTYTYFGRLGMSKGLDLLLPAAAEFSRHAPESRLQLIIPRHPAPFWREIQKMLDRYGLKEHAVLRHHLPFPELKKALTDSHCVVIPSYSEGFCFAAVESIALGVPVISSDKAALREVVSGKHLKMPEHSVEGLTQSLIRARQEDWEKEATRFFPLSDTVERYIDTYKMLIFDAGKNQ